MEFSGHLEQRLNHTMATLSLVPTAAWVLHNLARLDMDPETAQRVRSSDLYGRSGVISWLMLASSFMETGGRIEDLETAVSQLADWDLVQVVGQRANDPVVPGSSAHRLTHSGRVCLGLAPTRGGIEATPSKSTVPWQILHGSSREALLLHAFNRLGDHAWRPIYAMNQPQEQHNICGRLAVSLCTFGGAVVDGFEITERRGLAVLRETLHRTKHAQAPRILILRDPSAMRDAALSTAAQLDWIEPHAESRRGNIVLDRRVSTPLTAAGNSQADICGVPDSDIASPRRVTTSIDDLVLPRKERWHLEQSLLHARYRLEILPEQKHIPGKGAGYRLLLSGLPGTGKSLAAEAIATMLDRPLVKLDLSAVLSKWLGETEKLLGQVFDVAEASGSVLVLDEAESLFRQRDSGQSGGGALATGVAYLLTRLDRFAGVLIATTNRTRDLDEAFFRRFDDFIMPIPDVPTRLFLWRRMLGAAADGDDIDLPLLAEKFAISGGLIRGASIRALAWSQGLGQPTSTPLVLASLARELSKSDRATDQVLLEPYRQDVLALLDGKFPLNSLP